MVKDYIVRKFNPENGIAVDEAGSKFGIPAGLDEALLDCYPWDKNGYKPVCGCRMGWDKGGIHVYMYCLETEIRAEEKNFGDRVSYDSCMEVFMNPSPEKSDEYFSYECNPCPNISLSIGTGRSDRRKFPAIPEGLAPQSTIISDYGWSIRYVITADFLKKEFGVELSSGKKAKANFLKCGDKTSYPHYGCWNPIGTEHPDFHVPQYFGNVEFE